MVYTSTSQAAPVLLEKNYTNFAWGYQNQGCFADENGFVYTYNVAQKDPITLTKRTLSEKEIELASKLLQEAELGELVPKQVGADAGATLWSGVFYGKTVRLKLEGDYEGLNSSPATAELVKLIDGICP